MSRAEIVSKQLAENRAASGDEMAAVRAALPALTREELEGHLRAFLLGRFLLDPDCREDDIVTLSQLSIRRVLEMNERDLSTHDLGVGCSGAPSVDSKIILFMMALGRELEITISPLRIPALKTVPILADEVYALLKEAGRLA